MTSGIFQSVDINSIVVDRDKRQRRELTGIDELAESINRLGLIHPLVIDRNLVLVAGERRYTACRQLGWTHVPVQFADQLDDKELAAIELEENIKRVDISWQDRVNAVRKYHEIQQSLNPEWNTKATAAALGVDETTIQKTIRVAKEMEKKPEIAAAPKFSTARNMTDRIVARREQGEQTSILDMFDSGPIKKVENKNILNVDFAKWAPTYDGPKFNFIHCDFPYGINANKIQQGGSVLSHGGYEDSFETYAKLLGVLANNLDRICDPSAHIMFWFSMHFYQWTIDFFEQHTDFKIDKFPLIWTKSDNIGMLPEPNFGPRRIYETALFGRRGERPIVRSTSNSFAAPSVRDTHMSEKNEDMLKYFFGMFVDEHTSLLDPTCGSGSAVRAARALGAKSTLGLEVNEEFAHRATLKLEVKNGQS